MASPIRFEASDTIPVADAEAFCHNLPQISADPDESLIMHRGRNVVFRHAFAGEVVVIKHFRMRSPYSRIAYRIRPSKAQRSYANALRLIELGFDTPKPLAWAERWQGRTPREAFYVCAWDRDASQARQLVRHAGRAEHPAIHAIGHLAGRLHEAGVHHRDLTAGNVLYASEDADTWSIKLIDLNRVAFDVRLSRKAALRNLAQLEFAGERAAPLLSGYCVARGWNVPDTRPYYDQALAAHLRSRKWRNATRGVRRRLLFKM